MKAIVSALFAMLLSACAYNQHANPASDERGAYVLLVIRDGQTVIAESRGADPATTRFAVYSLAKPMTVAAALRLAEQGRLVPTADIRQSVPALRGLEQQVSALQLATHTSGIRHYRDGEAESECASLDEAIERFAGDPLLFEPGARQNYSSHGFVALSALIASRSDMAFDQAMQELVFAPLEIRPKLAPSGSGLSCKFGAGGYVASAQDMAGFGRGLFASGFLSERSQDLLLQGRGSYSARGTGPLAEARLWVRPEDRSVAVLLMRGLPEHVQATLSDRFEQITSQ